MTYNVIAANFAAKTALEHMAEKAGTDVDTIAAEIVNNPKGNTAQYFEKLYICGYDIAVEKAKELSEKSAQQ